MCVDVPHTSVPLAEAAIPPASPSVPISAEITGFIKKKKKERLYCHLLVKVTRRQEIDTGQVKVNLSRTSLAWSRTLPGARGRDQACTIPDRKRESAAAPWVRCPLGHAQNHAVFKYGPNRNIAGALGSFLVYSMITSSSASGRPHAKPVCASSQQGPGRKETSQVC